MMDRDKLQAIIDWMARSPLAELEIADGDDYVRLARQPDGNTSLVEPREASSLDDKVVVSPGFGTVHLSPSPDAPPFVTKGARIASGDTLCVIEAMKVFSPIEAEREGTLAAILVEDGAQVEAGQILFRLE